MPVGTAARHALGRQSLFTEVFSSCWRGRTPHANTRRVVADSLTQGIAAVKAPALPWATLLRPLHGLEAIFIRGGELERPWVSLRSVPRQVGLPVTTQNSRLATPHSVPCHLGPMWLGLFHKEDQRHQGNKHDSQQPEGVDKSQHCGVPL